MTQSEIRIPSLHGGISKQPDHQRFANQVEDASNARFDVVDGANKRPGTTYLRTVSGLTVGTRYRMHAIDRDENEKYIAIYGSGVLDVYHVSGVKASVIMTSGASGYINSSDVAGVAAHADEMRLTSVIDTTFIANSTIRTFAGTDVNDYTITDTFRDYLVMTSNLGVTNKFYQTSQDTASPATTAGFFQYAVKAGNNTWGYWTRTGGTPDVWKKPQNSWDSTNKNPMGFGVRVRKPNEVAYSIISGASFDHAGHASGDRVLTKTGAFANYSYVAGDEIRISSSAGSTLPKGWWPIAARFDDDKIQLTASGANTTYRQDSDNAETSYTGGDKTASSSDGITQLGFVSVDFKPGGTQGPQDSMLDIAKELQTDLQNAGANFDEALINYNGTYGNSEGGFQVVSQFRGAGSEVVGFYGPSGAGVYDLSIEGEAEKGRPFKHDKGTATPGTGTPTDGPTLPPDERWVQVAPPGQVEGTLDPNLSPITLVRTIDAPIATFNVRTIDYQPRFTGDENTNPLPKLWLESRAVADIAFYQDRLVFIGDQYVTMSEANNFKNFFVVDSDNVVDSDTIEMTVGGDGLSLLARVMPFRKNLFLMAKGGQQFELSFRDVLKQDSVAIDRSTTLSTKDVDPIAMQGRLYLTGNGCGDSELYEYFHDDLTVNSTAADVTTHVRSLLPTTIKSVAGHTNSRQVMCITGVDNIIYVYGAFWKGQEKIQSAWTKYTFDDSYEINDIVIIGDNLYLLVYDTNTGTWIIEYMSMTCEGSTGSTDVASSVPSGGGGGGGGASKPGFSNIGGGGSVGNSMIIEK